MRHRCRQVHRHHGCHLHRFRQQLLCSCRLRIPAFDFHVCDNFPPLCSWPCSQHSSGDLQVSIFRFLCPQPDHRRLRSCSGIHFLKNSVVQCTLGKLEFNALQFMVCEFVCAFCNESTQFIPFI